MKILQLIIRHENVQYQILNSLRFPSAIVILLITNLSEKPSFKDLGYSKELMKYCIGKIIILLGAKL